MDTKTPKAPRVKTDAQIMAVALSRNGWTKAKPGMFTHGDSGQVWVHATGIWDHVDKHGYYLLSGSGIESLTARFGLKGKATPKIKLVKAPKVKAPKIPATDICLCGAPALNGVCSVEGCVASGSKEAA
jgi:hypothetical protein